MNRHRLPGGTRHHSTRLPVWIRGLWLTRMTGFIAAPLALFLASQAAAETGAVEDMAPYKMLRSMQFVQDSVVLGDHSAAEMQRYLLETIDKRLHSADPSIFEDQRNVDAALIYTMSGGNPATLEYLVARDADGYFDNRVTDALRKYLSGKGQLVARTLGDMVPEYRDKKIGPYLALVSANILLQTDPVKALKYYDWARLAAPGTIIEEAALRRSVSISASAHEVDKGLDYARRYARRFLHSPYASQFVDLFVMLAVSNYGDVTDADIEEIVGFMDNNRKREVYLRIARQATIEGKLDLAGVAAANARKYSDETTPGPEAVASLYQDVANISGKNVEDAMENIGNIPEAMLSPRDRALQAAAQAIAGEVLRAPDAASLSQGSTDAPDGGSDPTAGEAVAANEQSGASVPHDAQGQDVESSAEFDKFVNSGRSKLEAIDGLLQEENASR